MAKILTKDGISAISIQPKECGRFAIRDTISDCWMDYLLLFMGFYILFYFGRI